MSVDSSLSDEHQNTQYQFHAVKGRSYTITIFSPSAYTIHHTILDSSGNRINSVSEKLVTSFIAEETGVYTVNVFMFLSETTVKAPYKYHMNIREFPKLDNSFNGKWLLVRSVNSVSGLSKTDYYSSGNALKLLEISNDTIQEIEFGTSTDSFKHSIIRDTSLFINSTYAKSHYEMNDIAHTLIFRMKNEDFSFEHEYVQFHGTAEDLKWKYQDVTISEDIFGTWYLSVSKDIQISNKNHQIFMDDTFNSGKDSPTVYVISKDSIVKFMRSGWGCTTEKVMMKYNAHLWSSAERDNDQLSLDYIDIDIYPNSWYANLEMCRLKKYDGELPPREWFDVVLPDNINKLSLDHSISQSVSLNDTLWFECYLEKDMKYSINLKLKSCEAASYLINSEPRQIKALGNSSSYSPDETGTYYIPVTVLLEYGEAGTAEIQLTVKKES